MRVSLTVACHGVAHQIPLSQTLLPADKHIGVAAQNCHEKASGAFTGETSAAMLKDLGVEWCVFTAWA